MKRPLNKKKHHILEIHTLTTQTSFQMKCTVEKTETTVDWVDLKINHYFPWRKILCPFEKKKKKQEEE